MFCNTAHSPFHPGACVHISSRRHKGVAPRLYSISSVRTCEVRAALFLFNYQKFVLNNAASAEESGSGAASLELSRPLTTPLLRQLEHLAARLRSRVLVGQDGRPEDC